VVINTLPGTPHNVGKTDGRIEHPTGRRFLTTVLPRMIFTDTNSNRKGLKRHRYFLCDSPITGMRSSKGLVFMF